MKIYMVTFSALFISTTLHAMQDQPIPGLQIQATDGKIYDICPSTGIPMRSVPVEEIKNSKAPNVRPLPGMLQALHEEITNSQKQIQ